jgi:hypothetical protein
MPMGEDTESRISRILDRLERPDLSERERANLTELLDRLEKQEKETSP